nr:hypothetical protein [Tanacetum cinerariifolium]
MKKQKPKRKQRKEVEVSHDKSGDEDHVSTPSSDPLHSHEDSFTLNELIVFCTDLKEQALDLQEAKATQAKKIDALKKKVTNLNKWRKSRSRGLRRLKKIGSGRRVKSFMKNVGLGTQEDASKQGWIIKEIDQHAKITLDDDTQGRTNDDEMFRVDDYAREEVVMDTTTGEHEEHIIEDVSIAELVTIAGEVVTTTAVNVSAAPTTYVTKDEITMAQALAALKSTKPKVVVQEQQMSTIIPSAVTTVTTAVPTPKPKKHKRAVPKKQKSSTKRTAEHLEFDISKKQKVDENVKPIIDDTEELKKCMEIVPDDGDETYFKIIRADDNSQVYQTFEKMFKNFNREDFEVLWAIVKDRFKKEKPVDDMDNLLFRTLKTMFEHHVEDTIWKYQQGLPRLRSLRFIVIGIYKIIGFGMDAGASDVVVSSLVMRQKAAERKTAKAQVSSEEDGEDEVTNFEVVMLHSGVVISFGMPFVSCAS